MQPDPAGRELLPAADQLAHVVLVLSLHQPATDLFEFGSPLWWQCSCDAVAVKVQHCQGRPVRSSRETAGHEQGIIVQHKRSFGGLPRTTAALLRRFMPCRTLLAHHSNDNKVSAVGYLTAASQ